MRKVGIYDLILNYLQVHLLDEHSLQLNAFLEWVIADSKCNDRIMLVPHRSLCLR